MKRCLDACLLIPMRSIVVRLWLALSASLFFAACQSSGPLLPRQGRDLVGEAREWRKEGSLAIARDKLIRALGEMDAAHGFLERRLWLTNAEKSLTLQNAASSASRAERARTGLFLVLGFRSPRSEPERIVRHVEAELRKRGWHAVLVEVPPHREPAQDAAAIQACLARDLPRLDRAVLVGFSKGGLDLMSWFTSEAPKLPARQREKIRLMVNFAGVLRGAVVGDWVTKAPGPVAGSMRVYLRNVEGDGGSVWEEVASVAEDPWSRPRSQRPRLRQLAPEMRVVNVVPVPEGKKGIPEAAYRASWLSYFVTSQWRWVGPFDGIAESASHVLPASAEMPQHIIRVLGSHTLLDGRYLNGGTVSKTYQSSGWGGYRGGEEMLDDLLRAIPRHWVFDAP